MSDGVHGGKSGGVVGEGVVGPVGIFWWTEAGVVEVPFVFYPGVHDGLMVALQVVSWAIRRMGWVVVRLFVLVSGRGGGRAASSVAGGVSGGSVSGGGGCGSASVLVLVWIQRGGVCGNDVDGDLSGAQRSWLDVDMYAGSW